MALLCWTGCSFEESFSNPSWEWDSQGCSSTATRGTKLGHRYWEKPQLILSICYHKGTGISSVISHDLHSLSKVILTGKKKAQHIGILPQMPEWNILFQLCCLVSFLSLEGFAPWDRLGHSRNTHKPCKKEQILYQRAEQAHPIQAWQTWVPFAACNAMISLFGKITACWKW